MYQELREALQAVNIDPNAFGNDVEAAEATLRQISLGRMGKLSRQQPR